MGSELKRTSELDEIEAALKRAAYQAVHGTREERSGRFMPAKTSAPLSARPGHDFDWEVFISHASEDKDTVARPLANHLAALGVKVWFDKSELRLGDSLRTKIDAGLARSRFGVVILSPSLLPRIGPKLNLTV